MKLYHGSNQKIKTIDLSKSKPKKDFGKGFYTTHLKEQAIYWSERIADRFGGEPTVTELEFHEEAALASGLNIKVFEHPDKEWAMFVMGNRQIRNLENKLNYDIVIGPVADDNMARLFGLYDLKIIDLETVTAGLTYKKLNSQYCFLSEKALEYLTIL